MQSIARLTGGPVDVFSSGDSSAGYVGGATIFQVGLLNIPVTTTYATEKSLRQFANTLHYQLGANTTDNTSADPIVGYQPAAFYPAGSISDSGRIWLTDPTLKGLSITTLQSDFTGTTLEGRGGTVYIDPPPNIGVLLFAGANILAVAPPAVAGPGNHHRRWQRDYHRQQ